MTKEELAKEAEENSFRYTLDKPWACEVERKQIMAHFEKGYLTGAEPKEKRIADLEAQIEKMKWHKVSDGDLPKDRHNVYVVYLNGDYQLEKTIASFRHKYWVFNGLKTECEIIAWCELPKWEIKEND